MHNGDGDTGYLAGLHPRGHLQILQDIDYRGRSVLTTFKQAGTLWMLLHIIIVDLVVLTDIGLCAMDIRTGSVLSTIRFRSLGSS